MPLSPTSIPGTGKTAEPSAALPLNVAGPLQRGSCEAWTAKLPRAWAFVGLMLPSGFKMSYPSLLASPQMMKGPLANLRGWIVAAADARAVVVDCPSTPAKKVLWVAPVCTSTPAGPPFWTLAVQPLEGLHGARTFWRRSITAQV